MGNFGAGFMQSLPFQGTGKMQYGSDTLVPTSPKKNFMGILSDLFGRGESIIDKVNGLHFPVVKTESEVKFGGQGLLVIGAIMLGLFFILKRK